MDLRPQGQDIIRTWLFSTVVRADLEFGALPWKHAGLSGWILDSDHKKMSKSKGNVVPPMGILEKYGSDAVRYWAASARLGLDAAFDEQQMKIGRRLAIKVLNASKFALTMGGAGDGAAGSFGADCPGILRALSRARGHGVVLLDVLRRLPGAGQGARLQP
jgi:valyl-tRNA synthetase